MSVLTVNKNNFNKEVLLSKQPVLLDFWAPWCGPCRMFSPVIDEIAKEKEGQVKVGKVNIDEEPELAQQFGVMSIPTVVVLKDGQVLTTSVGVKPKHIVEEMLKL